MYDNNPNQNDNREDMEAEEFEDIGSKGGESTNENEDQSSNDNSDSRGFASMNPDKQKEIASKGGKAAHKKGTAHEWDAEEAREAGRKGGQS